MQKKSYNHITSSLMRSSKVQASEEERDITKEHIILKIRECYKESRQLDALHFYTVPEGRDGGEKGRALGERTEERKEKSSMVEKRSAPRGEEGRAQREARRKRQARSR